MELLTKDDILFITRDAVAAAIKQTENHFKLKEEVWVTEEEAKKILNCKTSKLYSLRVNSEIKFTQGYKKKYLQSSIYAYLNRISKL